jgi:hypothetical protein
MSCTNDITTEMGEGIMDTEKLNEILRLHQMWLNAEPGGRRANLYGADLQGTDLRGADLSLADLRRANLSLADLSGTGLTRTGLTRADLTRADLSGANLKGAYLIVANLSGASLYVANLTGADLFNANLTRADLFNANLEDVDLHNTDLKDAKLPQGCKYYADLPEHNIIIIHDVAHIGCHSLPIAEWLERGPEIGEKSGYTPDQIDVYMEILRREHEAKRTE